MAQHLVPNEGQYDIDSVQNGLLLSILDNS